jgi:hypothetical protein
VTNADLSLFENVPLNNNRVPHVRLDAFNVFDIQTLGVPRGTTIGQAGAGAGTAIVGTPRQVQLGDRLVF